MNPALETLFFKFDTVPMVASFESNSEKAKDLWSSFCKSNFAFQLKEGATLESLWKEKASFYPEFSKIVSMSLGYLEEDGDGIKLKVKSFTSKKEAEVIDFFDSVASRTGKFFYSASYSMSRFDQPYLLKKHIFHSKLIPLIIDSRNKKPWEILGVDISSLLGNSQYNSSLDLISTVLNLGYTQPIKGEQVADTFYVDNNLDLIAQKSNADLIAAVKVYLRAYEVTKNLTITIA